MNEQQLRGEIALLTSQMIAIERKGDLSDPANFQSWKKYDSLRMLRRSYVQALSNVNGEGAAAILSAFNPGDEDEDIWNAIDSIEFGESFGISIDRELYAEARSNERVWYPPGRFE